MIQLNPQYEAIFAPNNIDEDCTDVAALLKAGHEEIQKTECYDNYGVPSYIRSYIR